MQNQPPSNKALDVPVTAPKPADEDEKYADRMPPVIQGPQPSTLRKNLDKDHPQVPSPDWGGGRI